ncbi:MAG: zinc ribbon domain-containing protein [Phycisphaeraceae bacterium]|nr:zinc ribbon domain-containing protein [Phycisphaeraceae bacterium]
MPTYDYVCDACEHEFEEFQMMSAKPLKKCPECGKNKLRRLIGTGAGIIFKGSGFYETDYRSDGYNKDKKADSEKKSEKKDSSEKKSESKPGPKSESTSKPDKPKPEKKAKKD